MRKAVVFSLALVALFAFAMAPVSGFACGESAKQAKTDKVNAETASAKEGCASKASAQLVDAKEGCASKTSAQLTEAKEGCSYSKQANATMASAHSQCTAKDLEACAAKLGVSVEEAKALCASGKVRMVNMSIEGMTCGGCEKSVEAALMKVPGVVAVNKVCYKTGSASVMINSEETTDAYLANAVINKGYKAEIIPAVAKTDAMDATSEHVKSGCTAAQKAACTAKETAKTEQASAAGTK